MHESSIKVDAEGVTYTDSEGDTVEVGLDRSDVVPVGILMQGDFHGAYLDRDSVQHLRNMLTEWLDDATRAEGLAIEYGARMMTHDGPSDFISSHGRIRNTNVFFRSTHRRFATPWEEIDDTPGRI